MTDKAVNTPLDMIVTPFQKIHPESFWLSLFFAPLIVGLLGMILIVPAFAVVYGYLPYLILGTPAFWIVLKVAKAPGHRVLGLIVAGFAVNFLSSPLYAWYFDAPLARWDFITMMGMIFAPLWAATMGVLYNRWSARAARKRGASTPVPSPSLPEPCPPLTPDDISKGAKI